MKLAALVCASMMTVLPAAATPPGDAAAYVAARQQADGGFAEPGRASEASLSAWSVLALRAAGRQPTDLEAAVAYLEAQPFPTANDLALHILALQSLGADVRGLADRLLGLSRPDGRIGPLVNSTAWGVLALRAAGRQAPAPAVAYLISRQHRSGGWSWARGGAPDSNDTAAVVQALRSAGTGGRPVARGLAYLRTLQVRGGGFALVPGREPDAQSTAWAIQAFVAARKPLPHGAAAFLRSLRRPDGAYRYTRRYATTPAIVTAQVVPALAAKAFPLR